MYIHIYIYIYIYIYIEAENNLCFISNHITKIITLEIEVIMI